MKTTSTTHGSTSQKRPERLPYSANFRNGSQRLAYRLPVGEDADPGGRFAVANPPPRRRRKPPRIPRHEADDVHQILQAAKAPSAAQRDIDQAVTTFSGPFDMPPLPKTTRMPFLRFPTVLPRSTNSSSRQHRA